jgi:ADP-dependent glucokinase
VSSLEEFDKLLEEFNPNLLVIGGLQMMDNYPYPKGKRTAQKYILLIIGKILKCPL